MVAENSHRQKKKYELTELKKHIQKQGTMSKSQQK